tara:strand:- start:1793 stop:2089 length:297 start_codon:yes stop_codon:yes gene_type:complete
VVTTYPAVITQTLTALTSNTIIHGLGVGVSEALLPKVFEPIFTTRRGAGNGGLGLSVVHHLISEVLKSEVYYESQPEIGFTLSFKIQNLIHCQPGDES